MKHVPMQHPSNEDLFAYRDGELAGEKRFLIEAHVVSCATCRELVDGMSGIEADLKSRPDQVGEEYYTRMTESVLGKIGAKSAAGAGAGAKSQARAIPTAEDAPRVERRRPDMEPEAEGRRRHLFPWFGVVGAGAAAAAVMVVVVMLAQRQGEWIRAPRPASAPEEPFEDRADSLAEPPEFAPEGPAAGAKQKLEVGALDNKRAVEREEAASGLAKENAPAPPVLGEDARARRSATASEKDAAVETRSANEELARGERQQSQKVDENLVAQKKMSATPQAMQAPSATAAAGDIAGGAPTDEYAAVLRAHGLPPVYDPARVSRDALLKAENDLRYLYMAGRAQTDSARVRLYLAEAARAKADPADSAAVEGVIHHYWRAIRLARKDPAVSAMAWRRLEEYQRETGRAP